jgi:hypothetical protein
MFQTTYEPLNRTVFSNNPVPSSETLSTSGEENFLSPMR